MNNVASIGHSNTDIFSRHVRPLTYEEKFIDMLCFAVVQHSRFTKCELFFQEYWTHDFMDDQEDYQRDAITWFQIIT